MPQPYLLLGSVLCTWFLTATENNGPINKEAAARYFRDAQILSDREGGKLWGKPLYGPTLLVDGESRQAVTNVPDADGLLHQVGDVYEGRLPDTMTTANTAVEWSGTRWSMVMWPLPEDRHARESLMMHESFHRIQKDLGLNVQELACGHLDSKEGRVWLQLEWRALGEALLARGPQRHQAIRDVLLFRAHRKALFPEADQAERPQELNEGLAEYTGIRASARSDSQALTDALVGLERGARRPTFVRSFAYASGPAYGLLLDASVPGWRTRLNERSDLGDLLGKALGIQTHQAMRIQAPKRGLRYGWKELDQDESHRDSERKARNAIYRTSLVDGPVLILPRSNNFNYSFDPNHLVPLEGSGMVYPAIQASGSWGNLESSSGALMTEQELHVIAPQDLNARPLKGRGWTLDLAPGWKLSPGPRAGDFRLTQEEKTTPAPIPQGPAK